MKLLLPLFLLLLLAGCRAAPEPPPAPSWQDDERYRLFAVYAMVQELLREQYVDAPAADYEALTRAALKGMLQGLDQYSVYDTPEEFAATRDELLGEKTGIGTVVVKDRKGFLRVVAVLPDTPAAKAGLASGDEIAGIDGATTGGLSLEECMKLLKGAAGTAVELTCYRDNDYEMPLTVTLERARYHRNSVPEAQCRMLDGRVAYIPIESFTATTAMELDRALRRLGDDRPEALILDLRNNPGGVVEGAVAVCSRFLEPGRAVVHMEGRSREVNEILYSRDSEVRFGGPMAVLINGYSASAAEIVAGALRDQNRAVTVGDTSFGKGSVQRIFELPDGGAVRFSIARYFTPHLERIDGVGVKPDIRVALTPEENRRVADQLLRDPAEWTEDDPQLRRALELLQ